MGAPGRLVLGGAAAPRQARRVRRRPAGQRAHARPAPPCAAAPLRAPARRRVSPCRAAPSRAAPTPPPPNHPPTPQYDFSVVAQLDKYLGANFFPENAAPEIRTLAVWLVGGGGARGWAKSAASGLGGRAGAARARARQLLGRKLAARR
jgi:hypothetical protein